MFMPSRVLKLTGVATALLLSGCHFFDANPATGASVATNTVTVTPSLGRISNARVILRDANSGHELVRGFLGTNGKAEFKIDKTVSSVIVEITGDGGGNYFDEAKGDKSLPSGFSMRAASAVSGSNNIGVTMLTEAAVQRATDLPGGLSQPANITQANKDIGDAMGISDITLPPTPITSDSDYQHLQDTPADHYALQLAGLVKAAAGKTVSDTPALELAEKLAADLKDGLIDGKSGNTAVDTPPYSPTPSVFQAAWQFGMGTVLDSVSDPSLKDKLKTDTVDTTTVKDPVTGPVIDGGGVFGGDTKAAWKGEIYQLAPNTYSLPDFDTLTPLGTLFTGIINIPNRSFSEGFPGVVDSNNPILEWFAIRYTGPLTVTETQTYTFTLNSDDGSKLFIDNQLVIDNDGGHAAQARSNSIMLTKGVHDIRVEYFQGPRYSIALELFAQNKNGDSVYLTPVFDPNLPAPSPNVL